MDWVGTTTIPWRLIAVLPDHSRRPVDHRRPILLDYVVGHVRVADVEVRVETVGVRQIDHEPGRVGRRLLEPEMDGEHMLAIAGTARPAPTAAPEATRKRPRDNRAPLSAAWPCFC